MAALLASGCAAPSAVADAASAETRILVKLVEPTADGDAVARRVAAATGTRVRCIATTRRQWHALALGCADSACDAALLRLRADADPFAAAQRDDRMRPATP